MLHLPMLSLLHALVAPQIPIDFCPGATADATATLGLNSDAKAVDEYGHGWAEAPRKCRRFVVDFVVPPDAKADYPASHGTLQITGGIPLDTAPVSQTACTALVVSTTIYKKAAGAAAFTKLGTYVQKGKWSNGRCGLEVKSGAPANTSPNPAGVDVYRVAVYSSADDDTSGVRAKIAFDKLGPQ